MGILVQRLDARKLAVFGFLMLAIASYLLSRLNLQVAMRNIVSPNILNGFGMGFIFVPLSTVMLGGLRNEQMGNATGIQNLVRNVGGSIGISAVSTMLERWSQTHQVYLAGSLSPLNPAFQRQLAAAQQVFWRITARPTPCNAPMPRFIIPCCSRPVTGLMWTRFLPSP